VLSDDNLVALFIALQARGVEVLSLCVGEPDFAPADHILEATKDAVTRGLTRYTQVEGTIQLRQAICDDLKKRKGLCYSPEEVLVSNGAKQCVYQSVLAVCAPGDEVCTLGGAARSSQLVALNANADTPSS
jgi:aspartate/methionine/tyrosine aminotransferase